MQMPKEFLLVLLFVLVGFGVIAVIFAIKSRPKRVMQEGKESGVKINKPFIEERRTGGRSQKVHFDGKIPFNSNLEVICPSSSCHTGRLFSSVGSLGAYQPRSWLDGGFISTKHPCGHAEAER